MPGRESFTRFAAGKEHLFFSWDFYAKLLIAVYAALQAVRLPILPQFMDIYYHLSTAAGFIRAGGYSTYDFWEFAPVGRPHIYPPLFHLMLAGIMRAGVPVVLIAKLCEALMPVVFLVILWRFSRIMIGQRGAFFALVMAGSSFSFYLSLMNHLPATLAMVMGIGAWWCLERRWFVRASILLAGAFYTHIGISWVFTGALVLYSFVAARSQRSTIAVLAAALVLAAPMIWREGALLRLDRIVNISERFFCEFKIVEYVLAAAGIFIAVRRRDRGDLISVSLLMGSFLLALYPYRFFSAEGYLPVILLSALTFDRWYAAAAHRKDLLRYSAAAAAVGILLFSPTVLLSRTQERCPLGYRTYFPDSALVDLMKDGRQRVCLITEPIECLPNV
ncbi:MAG: hypothetical protein WCG78_08605, partial [Candidatus Omnitrophota bacterium]